MLAVCALSTTARAQSAATPPDSSLQNAFPFVVPWNDGSKTLLSTNLNTQPAGANGRLLARGGHFVEANTNRRVRLVGIVWTFDSAFPEHGEADAVAARLSKYGVNAVRIHYVDFPGPSRATLWKSPGVLDSQQLDRLDYLLAQFKARGIYVNFNLKVARTFAESEGFPPEVAQLPTFSKRADYFDARMIQLQKDYARAVLTRRNSYTGLTLATDPGVYAVEINNENSLSESDDGAELLRLPAPFKSQLQSKWNKWLQRRYASTTALNAAWNAKAEIAGPELLNDTWELEQHAPVVAQTSIEQGVTRVQITQSDGVGWHAQLLRGGLDLRDGQVYTLSFRARADRAQPFVPLNVSRDVDDWRNLGLQSSLALSTEWKSFRWVFTAREIVPNHARVTLELGAAGAGTFEIANASLKSGAAPEPLRDDETLEAGRIPLPETRFGAVLADWRGFLMSVEADYVREMRDYLKHDLGVAALVINTQLNYGRLTGPYREAVNDYSDLHAYWDHPQTSGGWDAVGAGFFNGPMTPVAGASDKSNFGGYLMRYRVAGKPFSISEYNHPAPNEYAVETLPLLASVAARQDWDAWFLHEYGAYGANADTSKIQAYFAVGSDPNKWAFLPSMSVLFRRALVNPATAVVTASLPETFSAGQDAGVDAAWKNHDLTNRAFNAQTRLYFGALPRIKAASPPANDAKLSVADAETSRAVFSASAPGAIVLSGAVGSREIKVGSARFGFGVAPNNFAALTCVSWDNLPLQTSKHAVLTIMARARNSKQSWRADRRALTSWGQGPTLVDGVGVAVSLPCDGPRRVFALNAVGAPKLQLATTFQNGVLRFSVAPSQRAVWYAILK